MKYQIHIFTEDKTKIIKFYQNRDEELRHLPMEWEDFYYAMGAVIDDKAEVKEENDTMIALLDVQNISFDEVIDVMCEDLPPELTDVLVNEEENAMVELETVYY